MVLTTWLRAHAPAVLATSLVAVAGLLVAAVGLGTLAFLTGGDPLVTLGGALVSVVVLVTLGLVLAGALAWTLLTRGVRGVRAVVDGARRRVGRGLARLETRSRVLARLGLSARLVDRERWRAEQVSTLQRRYVDGDLTEAAFERRLELLFEGPNRAGTRDRTEGARDPSLDRALDVDGRE
jgi:hypothetical protein